MHDNTVITVIAWVTKYGDYQSTAIAGMLISLAEQKGAKLSSYALSLALFY